MYVYVFVENIDQVKLREYTPKLVKNYVLLSDLLDEQFLQLLNLTDRHKNL